MTTRRLPRLAWLLLISLPAGPAAVSAQSFECREVMVPMRDGVRLATDVYLPTEYGPGPFPTIVHRTPYNKQGCNRRNAIYFAVRGYAVVQQDERGRYNSEGEYYWLRDEGWGERQDGYDTIEWAASQPWSTGKIGTMGLSFHCLNQYLTAVTKPPHLTAGFCAHSSSNAYRDSWYPGGALHLIWVAWLLTQDEMAKPWPQNLPGHRGYVGNPESWLTWYRSKGEHQRTFGRSMISQMMRDMIDNPY